MTYIIGTTQRTVRWYRFMPAQDETAQVQHELLEVLDLSKVTQFASRSEAKNCLSRSSLRTFRYLKF